MGYAISSLSESVGTVAEHPILVLGIGLTAVVGMVLTLVISYIPFIGFFVSWIVPAIMLAAILTMAREGIRGAPNIGHLFDGISENAGSMLGAFALLFAVYFVVSIVFVILGFVLFFAGMANMDPAATAGSPGAGPPTETLGALGFGFIALIGVFTLGGLVVGAIIQFFDAAIVVGDAGALDSFKQSWGVFSSNPLSVIGYTVLRGIIYYVPIVVGGVVGFAVSTVAPGSDTALLAFGIGGLAFLVTAPVVWTLLFVYHVTYFDRASGSRSRSGGADGARSVSTNAQQW